jgi:hypothetical protein
MVAASEPASPAPTIAMSVSRTCRPGSVRRR